MATQRETLRQLCQNILTRLENNKAIIFAPRLRQVVADEVFGLVGPHVLTEQDLRERTLTRIGMKAELVDPSVSESDQFRAAKSVIRQTFGDDELHGFFFQKPLKQVANVIVQYLMRSSHIDEVYESDEDLEHQIVDAVKRFDPTQLH